MEIKENKRNELFKRQEMVVEMKSPSTPSYEAVRKEISEKISKPSENIDVIRVEGRFGRELFFSEIHAYDDKETLKKILNLRKSKKQKKAEEEAKKKAEEKPAEKAEE